MTIEDRVRRVLTDAVATEPPPRRAPLPAVRRRRRRPVLLGATALVLVLAAVIGLVAVRRSDRPIAPVAPTLTTPPTAGWPEVVDDAGNFRFQYPPGWEARRIRGGLWALAPRGIPRNDQGLPDFEVRVTSARSLWRSHGYWQGTSPEVGRLPAGQAYLLTCYTPAQYGAYFVDWGRGCAGPAAPGSCRPLSVQVEFRSATGRPSWDRYRSWSSPWASASAAGGHATCGRRSPWPSSRTGGGRRLRGPWPALGPPRLAVAATAPRWWPRGPGRSA